MERGRRASVVASLDRRPRFHTATPNSYRLAAVQCSAVQCSATAVWVRLAPFNRAPDLIGHSGISGAFAFHAPERDVTVCGTVNQIASRSRPYRLMVEALEAVRRSY